MLYDPVYRSDHDEDRADVERDERLLHFDRLDVRSATLEMELCREANEHGYHYELEDQRCFHEAVTHVLR